MVKVNHKSIISILGLGVLLSGCYPKGLTGTSAIPAAPQPIVSQYETSVVSISCENVDQEIFGKYSSNCCTFTIEDNEYEGYKIGTDSKDDNELFVLRNADSNYGIDELSGSFANVDPFDGICSINITYECDSDFSVYYGNDRNDLEYVQEIQASDEYTSYDIYFVENASYFRIEADEDTLSIHSLEIESTGEGVDETQVQYVAGNRYVPETDYNPDEGDVLKAAMCEMDGEENITRVDWKEYTYHSFNYARDDIENNGADVEEYALTDPVDVANYFVLFNRIPPNYGLNVNYAEDTIIQGKVETVDIVEEVFGEEYTRQVSEYDRNDGYVRAVPAANNNKTSTGNLYYEFDIALNDEYSVHSRGMGRVVGFEGGFYTNDDSTNVAIYTDDHYYTFMEYLNYGVWGERFDADGICRTGYSFDKEHAESILELKNK